MEKKRERSKNYLEEEKENLISIIEKYKHIIENKKTDSVWSKQKNATWEKIATEYNSISKTGIRNIKQLKLLYEALHKRVKKLKADDKVQTYITGGGMKVPVMTPQDDRIVAIMGPQIIPIETMYDSNNMHMPEDVYQGDMSHYEGDDAMNDIPLQSPPAMDIPSTSSSILPRIVIQDAKDSSQGGESVTLKTPKRKRKCAECEEMGDKKKEVLERKLKILDILRRKELVELELRQVELVVKKAEAE
ncbi:unnamed protein product [Diabrotica balteata]|uniref:Regulatory protein zeste n=1 Tax=Diabrotica balteata TaxID=107213 RepID=A0A9N9TCS6_DIABA|nr:unnamed protein product [Diabrotica balteata]